MDHKVSKDMISSGMIPSGEKTQADLGRTQYGSAPSPSKLMDAYKSMYEHHKKDADGNTIPHEGEELNEGKIPAGLQAYLDKKKGKKEDKKEMKEGMGLYANIHAKRKRGGKMRKKGDKGAPSSQDFTNAAKTAKEEVDKFDIVFNHFISEGYSEKEAYAEMSNLTEEQLDEILGALATAGMKAATAIGAKAKPMATALAKQGKANPVGKALGKVDTIAKVKPKVSPGQMSLDLKGAGMKSTPQKSFSASSPSQVVDPKENLRARTGGNQFGDEVKRQATQAAINKAMSGGGGKGQKERAKNISASADLFDIVKGQLLDEGLSEEEIKDIMLTLTPDEILAEMNGKATPEAGTGKYYDEKNPTSKQKEIQKNLPQNRKPTPEQQAARDKYAKIRDMTNKGDHQGASKLYNS